MKKKAIEKIGFLGLPVAARSDRRRKKAGFIGVTDILEIAGEEHFFLEVYRNGAETGAAPEVRFVLTKKDFGTYFPESGMWSRERLRDNYYSILLWEDGSQDYKGRTERNILSSQADLKRLKKFFPGVSVLNDARWWEYISQAHKNILREETEERQCRRLEKRRQALKDRMEHTPELPEQEMLSWADKTLFNKHYLYYRKKGRRAEVCCSACGGVGEWAWKAGCPETYESLFEHRITEPVNKHPGTCPMCGASCTYLPQGRANAQYSTHAYVWRADRYKETGAVLRYIQFEKKWVLEETVDEKGKLMMLWAHEKLTCVEAIRFYLHKGEKTQMDFYKLDFYAGDDLWEDCRGGSSFTPGETMLYPGFAESLKGTEVQYSAIELYAAEKGKVNAAEYMECYLRTPQIEMLVKWKLYGIVEKLLRSEYGIVMSDRADRPEDFLGIRKEKLKLLMEKRGDCHILFTLQMEKRTGQSWTAAQVEALTEIGAAQGALMPVLEVMTLQKLLNLISKYAGCEYGTGCAGVENRLRNTASAYFDYFYMRGQLGYDMSNTVYQRPRDLHTAHDRMVAEMNQKEQDNRIREAEERYPLIRKNYRKLRKRLFYEDETYLIRPARSAEEIILEGRLLHHCVGGDNYLRHHNEQESLILMLRFREDPELPYVTVELRGNRIMQWYGAHDKKPDEKNLQKWLDAYVARLKCGLLGAEEQAGQDAAMQILIPA